jgi:tetratricopeptide (TPR) repeat protein
MPPPVVVEAVPVDETVPVADPVDSRFEAATRFLEQALKSGPSDPQVAYLLALAYKRQGKTADARQALRKIARPDANVLLQLGLLSLQEQQLAQAEEELARAWEADAGSYEACSNLLLTRLTLGKFDSCMPLFPRALELAPGADERRFLAILQSLCNTSQSAVVEPGIDPLLQDMTEADEQRLLRLARSLGQLDTVCALLRTLAGARHSPAVHEAYVEAVLVQARLLLDQAQWGEASRLLEPLARDRRTPRELQVPLLNLLGCCACMNQDFEDGLRYLSAALKLAGNDPRLHQNLALTYEMKGSLPEAEPHWNRYFDLIDGKLPRPANRPDYAQRLAFEGLGRMVGLYTDKEKWQTALGYAQRALRVKADDVDMLERVFHLNHQLKRPEDARKALRRLRELRPGEPQYDLYEVDLIEIKNLRDVERVLTEIDQVRQRHPGEARVEERAVRMVTNVIPWISQLCDQYTERLGKIIDQVRNLPNYQINWPAVHDAMRELSREFRKLRRVAGKCLPLVTTEEHRRVIRDLSDHIDRKIEVCQSMGG